MTAAQAIMETCRTCQPGQRMTPEKCTTTSCKLSPNALSCRSSVKRIATHCRDCNGDDHPRECTGRLLDGGTCPLHPFRLGKNPHKPKRTPRPSDFRRHDSYQSDSRGPGSTIFPEVG